MLSECGHSCLQWTTCRQAPWPLVTCLEVHHSSTSSFMWPPDCVTYLILLYLPTQIRFLIGGERVTCHWSKLNDALGKHYLELWTCTWSGHASWNRGKFVCQPRQANNFYAVMAAKRFQTLYFELGGITKHLMTGPSGNNEFCFPSSLNIEVSGKQNSLFPLGPVIKCLMSPFRPPTKVRRSRRHFPPPDTPGPHWAVVKLSSRCSGSGIHHRHC